MSPVSTNASVVPSPSMVPSPKRSVPSLDELERMTSVPDERSVYRGVDWAFYEQLVDSIPERANIHVDYDGKDLEIMSKGANHEEVGELLGKLVSLIAYELEVSFKSFGETTWKRPEIARGLEADKSYYFAPEKLAAVAEEIVRWVVKEDISDESAWARRLRAWVQAELVTRAPR
jgi:Uma2 family endonuclease